MSHEIVKSIFIKKGKVFFNSADSSIRPLRFSTWESTGLSKILQESGREAALAQIGKDIFNGELHLYKGNKLCNLFLAAKDSLPSGRNGVHFTNFDSHAAGEYLAKAVMKLEIDPHADLSPDVQKLLELRNDKDHILAAAQRSGSSFLNYASEDVQKDRALAIKMVELCGNSAGFELPKYFSTDKEFVLEALKRNGCTYRQLDDSNPLKADKEVLLTAFEEIDDKRFHEHLPDLIPVSALVKYDPSADIPITLDREFICELLDRCPAIHLNRASMLLMDREIAMKWCEVGKFFPHSVCDLPAEFASDPDFQKVLVSRFAGTDKMEILQKKFVEKGIFLQTDFAPKLQTLFEKIQAAVDRIADRPAPSKGLVKDTDHQHD